MIQDELWMWQIIEGLVKHLPFILSRMESHWRILMRGVIYDVPFKIGYSGYMESGL